MVQMQLYYHVAEGDRLEVVLQVDRSTKDIWTEPEIGVRAYLEEHLSHLRKGSNVDREVIRIRRRKRLFFSEIAEYQLHFYEGSINQTGGLLAFCDDNKIPATQGLQQVTEALHRKDRVR